MSSARRRRLRARRAATASLLLAALVAVPAGAQPTDAPPTISAFFAEDTVVVGASDSLGIEIDNPNADDATGVAFTDTLLGGLTVTSPSSLSSTCGGTASASGGQISLSGGEVDAGSSCLIFVDVAGTTPGTVNNTTGAVSSNEGGTGAPSNTATVMVIEGPTLAGAFSPTTVQAGGTATLTFTVTNPTPSTELQNIGFDDQLPAGLVVANTPAIGGSCLSTATEPGAMSAGGSDVQLFGLGLDAGESCQASVAVTAVHGPDQANTTSPVQFTYLTGEGDTIGATAPPATAILGVPSPPSPTLTFGSVSLLVGQSTSLTFTLANPNASQALSAVGLTDQLPAGLTVSGAANISGCGAGQVTTDPVASTVTLAGASIAASSTCSFLVSVAATAPGTFTDSTGPVASTEGGSSAPATATLVVSAPPALPPAPPASTPPSSPPSNQFSFTNVVVSSTGVVTFTLKLPGAGSATILETLGDSTATTSAAKPGPNRFEFAKTTVKRSSAGSVKVRVTPNARGKKLVKHHKAPLVINLWVTFTPTGGRAHLEHKLHLHLPHGKR